ncbi:MAG: hypothetical protein ABH851_00595 [Methanobacteriota archaeon]
MSPLRASIAGCLGWEAQSFGRRHIFMLKYLKTNLMEKFEVYATDSFNKLFATLTDSEQDWIKKIKEQLEEHPTGKPLHYSWFREKKYLNKRLYYLVNEEKKKILFVSFAPKKDQKNIIDFIIKNKVEFLSYLKKL